ncbi:predicted protein [Chaetomium globosum CBS 148.51]|uniref:Uncharacterized protein n=1 Tax=Chaetomium globosum (strain ATCC 6205 / CBS 148.51 / DSM 1962 / NBRC 6347 / NRRL 1970) TaxID=306901 RepID=Q2GQ96_CHAGB|nr:uncharacterized protein CHGG_09858 [Chaetomium globosum CBS 148.51]EAQ83454.1 predicted protein [Chaetomium globosum CBS 148.51]
MASVEFHNKWSGKGINTQLLHIVLNVMSETRWGDWAASQAHPGSGASCGEMYRV